MQELWNSLIQLFGALWNLVVSLGAVLLPLLPLAAWVAFWTFGVDWRVLSRVLRHGGAVGLLLLGLVAVLVWGVAAPPAAGYHYILGLYLSNYFGKLVYVTTLICIMLVCGSVQLSGLVDCCCDFSKFDPPADEHAHGDHGHGEHGHGHDAHGGHGPADHAHAASAPAAHH